MNGVIVDEEEGLNGVIVDEEEGLNDVIVDEEEGLNGVIVDEEGGLNDVIVDEEGRGEMSFEEGKTKSTGGKTKKYYHINVLTNVLTY